MTHFPGYSAARDGHSCGRCDRCGKMIYDGRRAARRARQRMPDIQGLNAYPCPHNRGWHLGHLVNPVGARDRICAAHNRRMTGAG